MDLEKERLAQEREIAEKQYELELRKHRNSWRTPVYVAAITIGLTFATNYVLNSFAQKQASVREQANSALARTQFCFELINDLVFREPIIPGYSSEKFDELVKRLAQVSDCEGRIEQVAAFGTEAPPAARCEKIVPIQALGWRSGHKTNFCISRGFSGVHNPFGDYGAGGFCFLGDSQTCIAEIAGRISK